MSCRVVFPSVGRFGAWLITYAGGVSCIQRIVIACSGERLDRQACNSKALFFKAVGFDVRECLKVDDGLPVVRGLMNNTII